jgi:pentatricopeptide repeat protein
VYGIHYQSELHEREVTSLAGYRGMGPVRAGNDAWRQVQNDVHGSVVLAASQAFFDRRLDTPGDAAMFGRLVPIGRAAAASWDTPDAGLWEYRGRSRVHTYSSVMCWAACDRLAKIATHLRLGDEASDWRGQADVIRTTILDRAWSEKRRSFVESTDDLRLDASTLLLADVGFVAPDDPRFVATVDTVGRALRRGNVLFRYEEPDDFGMPTTAFNVCTWWYVDALASVGRHEEARELFEHMLSRCNPLGLMSEDMDPTSGEAWGNFPQTYSAVGLISAAMRLSRRWEDVV